MYQLCYKDANLTSNSYTFKIFSPFKVAWYISGIIVICPNQMNMLLLYFVVNHQKIRPEVSDASYT